VVDVNGEPLSGKKAFTAKAQLTLFKIVSPFLKELFNGMRGGQGTPITLWHRSIDDPTTRWTIAGDRTRNCAIRPLRNASQNLNVLGNGPCKPGSAVSPRPGQRDLDAHGSWQVAGHGGISAYNWRCPHGTYSEDGSVKPKRLPLPLLG
jgi:hypothetical protein